jgi:thiosulfate reductase cytochrome b subunit
MPAKIIPLTKNRTATLLTFSSLALLLVSLVTLAYTARRAWARDAASRQAQASPLHPTFPLLDQEGNNVLESGKPLSTLKTCGACHDSAFIAEHSDHAAAGLETLSTPAETTDNRPWVSGSGWFGGWNPLTYRYLTQPGDARLDLSTAEWIMRQGARHAGSGPAVESRGGQPLTSLAPDAENPESSLLDPESGQVIPWDWAQSGVVEMNCFLCHTPHPDNQARLKSLQAGAFAWANTATLLGSGIVEQAGDSFQWNPEAFDAAGELRSEFIAIQDPTNENCGLCHGLVHDDLKEPLYSGECSGETWHTMTTGQIISPQKLSDSGMNLAGKEALDRTWDAHAEHSLKCTDCHYSLNNPVYFQGESSLEHLSFDPRRIELGEYLLQPVHQLANGQSAQTGSPELKDSMRRCESCHSLSNTHEWLPYKERHAAVLTCETCHVPRLYAPAVQQVDWTVLRPDGDAASACRGIVGGEDPLRSLVTGFEPALLARQETSGEQRIAPYNLVSSWYWVYDDPQANAARPVRQADLQAAWLDGEGYPAEILTTFDLDGDGSLSDTELRIDTPEKESLIASRLADLGLQNPRIYGEVQPYSISHTIATAGWAIRDCQTCHSDEGRLAQPVLLAAYTPGGTTPQFVSGNNTLPTGDITLEPDGTLYYQPHPEKDGLYVLGHNQVSWIDRLGGLLFLGVLIAIVLHATLRYLAGLRRPAHAPDVEKVYMYSVYERFWHWLQTLTIVLLLFTGLIIHDPDTFGVFSFRGVVLVHNILAVILVFNAGLSLFYHLASGEIKQYIPRPAGFFDQAIQQASYYLRGIFRGQGHPFEKTPGKKLNPLQQVTYFAILNVLLPMQIISGILMWGAQRWPEIVSLPLLAPFHTLIAWVFASFIVAHVCLTTTGPEPLAGIKAMMMGWEDVETMIHTEEMPSQEASATSTQEATEA